MKLLLDENLSVRIISRVADLFPDSTHVKAVGLREADDFVVWEWGEEARGYDQTTQIFIKGLLCLAIRRSSFGYVSGIARLA